ncbi:MAG: threonylcarbamoyl-AMP synthase [Bacteroidetes bacterium]|nr:threonylcarbamoyl-AMP synthase [Bacteroidota bacterium]
MYFKQDIEESLEVLHKGGLILYPTDTVWGIGCDATNENAVARIYRLKNRNEQKSMIVLLAQEKDILNYTNQPAPPVFDYIKGANKPVTVIYSKAKNLAANLVNADGSIGIRIVKDEFCRRLIEAFGKPLVSTSSNISGYPAPGVFSDIDIKIKDGVDYIVYHRQDEQEPSAPSTVIKLNDDGSYTVIRP